MTRKDFVLIAQVIKYARVSAADRKTIAEDFSRALKGTNERFDSGRFFDAATENAHLYNTETV